MKNLLGQVKSRTDSSSIFLNSRWISNEWQIVIQIVAKYLNDRDYV